MNIERRAAKKGLDVVNGHVVNWWNLAKSQKRLNRLEFTYIIAQLLTIIFQLCCQAFPLAVWKRETGAPPYGPFVPVAPPQLSQLKSSLLLICSNLILNTVNVFNIREYIERMVTHSLYSHTWCHFHNLYTAHFFPVNRALIPDGNDRWSFGGCMGLKTPPISSQAAVWGNHFLWGNIKKISS